MDRLILRIALECLAVEVGFGWRVVVGNIFGVVLQIYIGAIGEPSNR